MKYKKVACKKCGSNFEVEEALTSYSCPSCHAIHFPDSRLGSQAQVVSTPADLDDVEQAGTGPPEPVTGGDISLDDLNEAERYKLQAEFILHEMQANISVYGSNSAWSGARPADVDLALRYINRSLELFPDNPAYLNLKALFLMEGLGQKEAGIKLLERAAELSPRDITIQDNLEKSKSSQCFIATAAYGSSHAWQVESLRNWRDNVLLKSVFGRRLVLAYYRLSPPMANLVASNRLLQALVRLVLFPLTSAISRRDSGDTDSGDTPDSGDTIPN